MATATLPNPATPATLAAPRRRMLQRPNAPILSLLVVYVLLVPMLIVGVNGNFGFEHSAYNTDLGAAHATTAGAVSSSETDALQIQSAIVGIVVAFAAFWVQRNVIKSIFRSKMVMAFPFLCALSTAWSLDGHLSIRRALFLLFTTMLALALDSRLTSEQIMQFIMFVGMVITGLSVFMVVFFPDLGLAHEGGHEGVWRGIYNHKNPYGLAMVAFLTPAFFARLVPPFALLRRGVYVVLILAEIYLSHSTTALGLTAEYFALVFIFFLISKFRKRDVITILPLVIGSAAILIPLAISYLPLLLVAVGKDPTLTGRTDIWSAVFSSYLKRPLLGFGYQAFWGQKSTGESAGIGFALGWDVTSAHSGYLEVMLELGLVGLVLVLLAYFRVLKNIFYLLGPGMSRQVRWFATITLLIAINAFDETILIVPFGLHWTLFIIAYLGLNEAARQKRLRLAT